MPRAADPVVEHQVTTITRCPPELLAKLPAKPDRPAGGYLEGDQATLDWLGKLARWAEGLAGLFADAQSQCPS